ncbi:Cbr1 [Acrasis kona]|uniref:Cbr1 n=1 Tax=Acrasis kona TaxID=1008807 RepID=A0AAW2YSE0_9EUKA
MSYKATSCGSYKALSRLIKVDLHIPTRRFGLKQILRNDDSEILRQPKHYEKLNKKQLSSICVFCNDEAINEGLIVESEHFRCLYNIRPVFPGHVLIMPKRHLSCIEYIESSEAQEYLAFTQNIIKALKRVYSTDSINVLVQEGPHSGQSIQHLHTHFLPRTSDDIPKTKDGTGVEEDQEWMDFFRKQEHTGLMLDATERQLEAKRIREVYFDLINKKH